MDSDDDPLDEVEAGPAAVDTVGPVGRESSWARRAFDTLALCHREYLSGMCVRRPYKYASDCSGADSPKSALCDIFKVIHQYALSSATNGEPAKAPVLRYLFASEAPGGAGDAARALITMNGGPEVMVEDMLKTSKRKKDGCAYLVGRCSYARKRLRLETPDNYTFGFECQDRSSCNTCHQKPLAEEATEEQLKKSGQSNQTLHASMRTIDVQEPPTFLVEHTFRKDTIKNLFEKRRHYATRLYVTTSKAWGLPMRRKRIYAVGVHKLKCRLRIPMREWKGVLQRMCDAQAMRPSNLSEVVLPDSHPAVSMELAAIAKHPPRDEEEYAGKGWAQNYKMTVAVRKNLATQFKCEVPQVRAWTRQHFPDNSWMHVLPVREQEVLCCHAFALDRLGVLQFETSDFCWDI